MQRTSMTTCRGRRLVVPAASACRVAPAARRCRSFSSAVSDVWSWPGRSATRSPPDPPPEAPTAEAAYWSNLSVATSAFMTCVCSSPDDQDESR